MKILHIETSSRNCSVAISDGSELLCVCEETSENYKQSESLHTFVLWALEGAGITLQDLDAVSLGKGPGSYTGLRIGAASAKGFCYGLRIPLIAVNSLDILATPYFNHNGGYDLVIPLVDARRMEVYTAVYDAKTGKKIVRTKNLVLEDNSFEEFGGKKILFVGDGAKKAQEVLRLSNADFIVDVFPSAKNLLKTSVEKFIAKDFADVAYFEPFYLKDFHGVKKAERVNE